MAYENLHEKLQQASEQIKEARQAYLQAQGSDAQLLQQTLDNLEQAEQKLQDAQNQAESEATENSQFQQAYQEVHDMRQQVEETLQNKNDFL